MKTGKRGFLAVGGLIAVGGLLITGWSSADTDDTTRDATGAITEGGELGAFRLTVGDCLYDPAMLAADDETDEVESFRGVACDEPHTGEVLLVDDEFFADDDSMPSEEAMQSRIDEACIVAVEDYTGIAFEKSPFGFYSLFPTREGWVSGDRGISCVGTVYSETTWVPVAATGSIEAGSSYTVADTMES